jgi:uncharacterized membrane protein (DUF2068 family)
MYEIYRHVTWVRVGAMVVNVAIVAYLVYKIRGQGRN